MSQILQSVDERTQLAGTNRIEILLFSLGEDEANGQEEVYGINVFKVREVILIPKITRAPEMPDVLEGMVSIRGSTIPVINLIKYCGIKGDNAANIMIVTEYNNSIQGFLVNSVDNIERLAWENIKTPPKIMDSEHGGLITAVTEVDHKGLVMIMDVEKILVEAAGLYQDENVFNGLPVVTNENYNIIFADDSSVARGQIKRTFEEMGVTSISAVNGLEAWNKLVELAENAENAGRHVRDEIHLILTDIEMPEMDGYVLTRKVKEDPRFNGIPVVMHSSLSATANQSLGESVGVDAYVPKFKPAELAGTILGLLAEARAGAA